MREMMMQEGQQNLLWYDERKIPPGMKYGWIRRAVYDFQDQLNVRSRQQSGWKPVPADRHPELSVEGWGLPNEVQRSYIEVAGLVLCEIPLRVFKRHQDYQAMLAMQAIQLPHIQDLGNPAAKDLPMWGESTEAIERVRSSVEIQTRRPEDREEFKE